MGINIPHNQLGKSNQAPHKELQGNSLHVDQRQVTKHRYWDSQHDFFHDEQKPFHSSGHGSSACRHKKLDLPLFTSENPDG